MMGKHVGHMLLLIGKAFGKNNIADRPVGRQHFICFNALKSAHTNAQRSYGWRVHCQCGTLLANYTGQGSLWLA
jgi:hypothetical protein